MSKKIAREEVAETKTEKSIEDEQKTIEEKLEELIKETEEAAEEKSHTEEETSDTSEIIEENLEIEEKPTIVETIEEVIVEKDNLKISKKDDIYTIKTEHADITFTKDYVVENERFVWVEENRSCVLVINGELVFLDYHSYSEIFLER